MKFGYMRVSTLDQNLDRMLEFLRPEDTVVVTDLTRLSRSTKDLIVIMELISQKGAHLKSLKESC